MIRAALFCLSAASIARAEATGADDASKNKLCRALGKLDTVADWLPMMLGELEAQKEWGADPAHRKWLSAHRLTGSNLRSAPSAQPNVRPD